MKFVRYVFHGSSSPCPGGGKRRFAFGIWAALVAVAVVVGSVPALAAASVNYLDASGQTQTKDSTTELPEADSNKVTLGNANNETWYSTSTKEIDDPIEVTGTVHLILVDSTTLTAKAGISLASDATLNIYAQSATGENIGKLTVYKGIAGDSANLTINGGVI
ncbi:MAG: hypothetical protein II877_13495, partial [Synergistaceae bacterium]|nr:hypothetical protein [Synergistaceae bacterium]